MWLLVLLLVQTAAFGFHEKEWHEKSYDCYPMRAQQYRENQQAHGFGESIIALCAAPVQWAIFGGCCAYAVGKKGWDWWSDNYGSRYQQKVCEKNIHTLQRVLHKDQHQYPQRISMCNYVESHFHEAREYRDFSAALNNQLLACAKKYDITKKQLAGGYFNAYEYHLHNEFITQLLQATALSSYCPKEYDAFIDSVGMSSALGLEANHKQDIVTATYWAELGWQMLDVVKAVVEGAAEGVQKGVVGTLNMVIHPGDTAQTVLHGICLFTRCCISVIGKVNEIDSLMMRRDYEALKQQGDQAITFLTNLATDLSTVPKKDIIRHISSFGTEIMVSGKLFSYAPDICRKLRMACAKAIELIKDEQKVAQAVQLLTESGPVAETIKTVGPLVEEVVQDARLMLEAFQLNYMQKLQPEIMRLKTIFNNRVKGFAECANKYIKIDYEHILGIALEFGRKGVSGISGFHYDFMHFVENSGFVQFTNKIIDKYGFYTADLIVNGKIIRGKTFFPAHWTCDQVVEAIYEALHNYKKTGINSVLRDDGKYKIIGTLNNGIDIEMVITRNGKLVTAYPLIK